MSRGSLGTVVCGGGTAEDAFRSLKSPRRKVSFSFALEKGSLRGTLGVGVAARNQPPAAGFGGGAGGARRRRGHVLPAEPRGKMAGRGGSARLGLAWPGPARRRAFLAAPAAARAQRRAGLAWKSGPRWFSPGPALSRTYGDEGACGELFGSGCHVHLYVVTASPAQTDF